MGGEITHIEAILNRTVYIMCEADGIPAPSIMWLKDNVPLLDFPYRNLRLMSNGHQLEIRNVQVKLYANINVYVCTMYNLYPQNFQYIKRNFSCGLEHK